MAVGHFTKEEADIVKGCIIEMFDAIPNRRQGDLIGHFNEALCFVEAAKRVAPAKDD